MNVKNVFASTIYQGGTVITLDNKDSIAEAVALDGESILFVGNTAGCSEFIGPDTEVIDLGGKTMLPGFYDPHSHFSLYASFSRAIDLRPTKKNPFRSVEACQKALRAALSTHVVDGWLIGWNFDMSVFEHDPYPLTRDDLDAVSSDVGIIVYHQSLHSCMANSKALEDLGIDKNSKDPVGGQIGRYENTTVPNGILYAACMHQTLAHLSAVLANTPEGFARATQWYASKGVTTANDGATRGLDKFMSIILDAEEQGLLATRVVIHPGMNDRSGLSVEDFVQKIMKLKHKTEKESGLVRIGGAKLLFDGSIQLGTAYMSQPYHNNPDNCGFTYETQEALVEMVTSIHKAGHQVLTHCNGDAAITGVIDVYKAAWETENRSDMRHALIHAQTITDCDLQRVAELSEVNVVISFFPPHIYYLGDSHASSFIGPARAARMNPIASAIKLGIPYTTHDDAPIFDIDPLMTIWSAVNRMTKSGQILGADERISVLDAIKGVTINAAYQHHEDKITGSIEAGKRADLVILNDNPLACDKLHIKDIDVLETIMGGKTTYILK